MCNFKPNKVKELKSKNSVIIYILLYIGFYLLLYPLYKYSIDADATGYLSVAEKVAAGNYYSSLNGIWSPLGSWLVVPFLKMGINGILAAKIINAILGIIALAQFFNIIYTITQKKWLLHSTVLLANILLLYFSYYRLFGDMLVLVFLISYLNITLRNHHVISYKQIILSATILSLGFYAKAYVFYFALFFIPITLLLVEKFNGRTPIKSATLQKILIAILIMLFLCMPWVLTLSGKYGTYILGQKNVTGTLMQIYAPNRHLIIPPLETNYASFDDISNLYPKEITPMESWDLFMIQSKLIVVNIIQLLKTYSEFSVFFITILFIMLAVIFQKNNPHNLKIYRLKILSAFLILYTVGYLPFSVQGRFLWINILVIIIAIPIIIELAIFKNIFSVATIKPIHYIIILSFAIFPIIELKELSYQVEQLHIYANALKGANIRGKTIATNDNYANLIIVNYLSGNKFYGPNPYATYKQEELLQAINKYDINYYLFYYHSELEKDTFLKSDFSRQAQSVNIISPGLIVSKYK